MRSIRSKGSTGSREGPRDRSWIRRLALRLVLVGLVLYALVLAAVFMLQERLLLHPTKLPADHQFAFGADVHETTIAVEGATLSALHLRRPAPRALVFYLHGNAGSLENWFARADDWRAKNVDLFMIDYRGYGKSTGSITSEAQLRADVRKAWDAVVAEYPDVPKIIVGRSLGTALAAGLAADVEPALTVLISPYRSITAMAALQFPWVPSFLLRYPLDTERDVAGIAGPVLVIHGEADALIPLAHGEAVARAAARAELVAIPGAGHDDVHAFADYGQALERVIATLDVRPS